MHCRVWNILHREWQIWRASALPGLFVIALVVLARLGGHLQLFEWVAFDYLLRLRPPEPVDQRILIVGIDEEDIRILNTYPISDQTLAALLQQLEAAQPSAIGIDIYRDLPVQPGHTELVKVFQTYRNIIGIEQALPDAKGNRVKPPPKLPPEQIGFADAFLDADGNLRRVLLGTPDFQNQYKFSLPVRLAEIYLRQRGNPLGNGKLDQEALRFGQTELTRFQSDTGGYVATDAGGNQILLNVRSGAQPFRVVSLNQVLRGEVPTDWIRDRVVLVGMMALSVKDMVNSRAIDSSSDTSSSDTSSSDTSSSDTSSSDRLVKTVGVYGVEIHAHTVSQLISTTLDQRPLIHALPEGWEYLWIVAWGILGISLGRMTRSPLIMIGGIIGTSVLLLGSCYAVLLLGWWLPLVPAWLALVFSGTGLTAAYFYRHDQDLQTRKMVIDQTFHAIHNGPLQILAGLLRQFSDRNLSEQAEPLSDQQIYAELQRLNDELRTIYEFMRRESLLENHRLYLIGGLELDLQGSLGEVLYEVYSNTLQRNFPHFRTLQLQIPDFGTTDRSKLNDAKLSLEQKRQLCRFLEEALCNVGKHAQGVTRLEVLCRQEQGKNWIRVSDNGVGLDPNAVEGQGTQQAKQLARRLKGNFRRSTQVPQGTVCELSWSV